MVTSVGWLTYMRAYSPRWNLKRASQVAMNVSIKISRIVCPAIELFFQVQTRLGQWFSRELIRDECIHTRLTFAAQLIWVWCSDQIGNSWDKDQLSGVSVDVSFSLSLEACSVEEPDQERRNSRYVHRNFLDHLLIHFQSPLATSTPLCWSFYILQ